MTDSLKDFLVRLSIEVDDQSKRKFQNSLLEVGKRVAELAIAFELGVKSRARQMDSISSQLESLYYQAKRTGTTVGELRAWATAAERVGVGEDKVKAALEGFASQMRYFDDQAPIILEHLGVKDPKHKSNPRRILEIIDFLKKQGYSYTVQVEILRSLGISDELAAFALTRPEFVKQLEEAERRGLQFGIDPNDPNFGKGGTALQTAKHNLWDAIDAVFLKVTEALGGESGDKLNKLADIIDKNSKAISDFIIRVGESILKFTDGIIEFLSHKDDWVPQVREMINNLSSLATKIDDMVKRTVGWQTAFEVLVILLLGSRISAAVRGFRSLTLAFLALLAIFGLKTPQAIGAAAQGGSGGEGGGLGQLPGGGSLTGEAGGEGGGGGGGGGGGRIRQGFHRGLAGMKRAFGMGAIGEGKAKRLSANQKEAYAAAIAEGLTPQVARAVVANLTGEGLKTPGIVNWDVKHWARGIVQWDPQRSARIKAQFGKYPNEMSVAGQVQAMMWEAKNYYKTTYAALKSGNAALALATMVYDYERPANPAGALAQRRNIYSGLGNLTGSTQAAAAASPPPAPPDIPRPVPPPPSPRPGATRHFDLQGSIKPTVPMGVEGTWNKRIVNSSTEQHLRIDVHGADPETTAQAVARHVNKSHDSMVRSAAKGVGGTDLPKGAKQTKTEGTGAGTSKGSGMGKEQMLPAINIDQGD